MNDSLKNAIRFAVLQFFIITVCVMFVISFFGLFADNSKQLFDSSFPWIMMLTGLLTSLLSFLFYFKNEPTRKQFNIRRMIHFFSIEAVVLLEGFLLGWYTSFIGALVVAAMIMIVYTLVWIFSAISDRNTASSINKALQNLNADED